MESGRFNVNLLRRAVLQGTWLYGRSNTVESARRALNAATTGPILLGGLASPDQPVPQRRLTNPDSRASFFWDIYPDFSSPKQVAALQNREDLFATHKKLLIGMTIVLLGGYAVTSAIGLPLLFVVLKGSRRVRLWWTAPVLASGFSLVAFVFWGLLPKTPQVDVSEYRLCYAPWEEVYCHDVFRMLAFHNSPIAVALPDGSFLMPGCSLIDFNRDLESEVLTHSTEGTRHEAHARHRGQILISQYGRFEKRSPPVEVRWADGKPRLKATAGLEQVHVWENQKWHLIGALQPGQQVGVSDYAITNQIAGLPRILTAAIDRGPVQPDRMMSGRLSRKIEEQKSAFGGSWIVVAVSVEKPGLQLRSPAETSGRVIWVVQLPLLKPVEATDKGVHP